MLRGPSDLMALSGVYNALCTEFCVEAAGSEHIWRLESVFASIPIARAIHTDAGAGPQARVWQYSKGRGYWM